MGPTNESLRSAEERYAVGDLRQAEEHCRRVLSEQPRCAPALHLLGAIALRAGRHALAVEYASQAVRVDGGTASYHATLGEAHRALGQAVEAIASFRRALSLLPESADLHFRLGLLWESQGDAVQAADHFAQSLRLAPTNFEAALHLGQSLFTQGRLGEAEARFEATARAWPNLPWAHCGLGFVYYAQGRLDRAVDSYHRAIELEPNFAEAYHNLGVALVAQDRTLDAVRSFELAVRHRPAMLQAHLSLATTHLMHLRPDEAVAASRRVIELAPASHKGYAHLGSALQLQGDMDGAIGALRRAVDLEPSDASVHSNLVYALNFHPGYDAGAVFREHLAWSERHAEPLTAAAAPHHNDRAPERRLRVGYVSAHFREHAVSFFSEPMIQAHDPAQVEVYCYSDVVRGDAVTERFRAGSEAWRDIAGLSDAQVAEQVRHDGIDILVDLAGHIGGNRLRVFARRPAPVQVTYLGYQNTTGMSAMDYRLTDEHANPSGQSDEFYTERLVRLPRSFFCFAPSEAAPDVNPLPALARGQVTFASLDHINKLTRQAFLTWAQILREVSGSRLIVLAYAPGRLATNVRNLLASEGIDPQRVEIVNKRPRYEYLLLHHEIDVCLDTFPFNGHTTVCDALWMGVPSIMLEGSSYASRFGTSTLHALGLSELVARNTQAYVGIAASLAADLERLAHLRSTLRARMRVSPLMDYRGFARHLETTYRAMWRQWCEKD